MRKGKKMASRPIAIWQKSIAGRGRRESVEMVTSWRWRQKCNWWVLQRGQSYRQDWIIGHTHAHMFINRPEGSGHTHTYTPAHPHTHTHTHTETHTQRHTHQHTHTRRGSLLTKIVSFSPSPHFGEEGDGRGGPIGKRSSCEPLSLASQFSSGAIYTFIWWRFRGNFSWARERYRRS